MNIKHKLTSDQKLEWQKYRVKNNVPATFVSDGCTGVPELNVTVGCMQHDWEYTVGGNRCSKLAADIRFYKYIKKAGHPIMAILYFLGVRSLTAADRKFNYHTVDTK